MKQSLMRKIKLLITKRKRRRRRRERGSRSPIEAVAVVGVDGEDPESRLDQGGVEARVSDAGGHILGEPSLPQRHNLVVQP